MKSAFHPERRREDKRTSINKTVLAIGLAKQGTVEFKVVCDVMITHHKANGKRVSLRSTGEGQGDAVAGAACCRFADLNSPRRERCGAFYLFLVCSHLEVTLDALDSSTCVRQRPVVARAAERSLTFLEATWRRFLEFFFFIW